MSARWLWGGAAHPGGRDEQQDRWGVFATGSGLLAVVADGMGGHRNGALGAQAVLDSTAAFARDQAQALCKEPAGALGELCARAHVAVVNAAPKARSTVVVLWLHRDRVHWIHAGDSRFYHMRGGRCLVRTRDHSAAQMLVELGEISEAEIAAHPDQSRLYRSLGSEELPRCEIGCARVGPQDLLVLCSDGVWIQVGEQEVWETAAGAEELSTAAAALVGRAAERGGPRADNATVVLIRMLKSGVAGWFHRG